jgi:hypothetical protein
VQNTFTIRDGAIFSTNQVEALARTRLKTLTPAMGISFSLLGLMYRVTELVRRRRTLRGTTWDDDQHVDIVQAAEDLQDLLRDEKKRLDALVKGALRRRSRW